MDMQTFMERVEKRADGCWLWTGGRGGSGYGQFRVDGRMALAHRWSYEAWAGPIPAGLEIDHLCRVRACVNPEHLEPVTRAENQRRGMSVGGLNYRKAACVKGHPFDAKNTYLTPAGARQCRACGVQRNRKYRESKVNNFRDQSVAAATPPTGEWSNCKSN